MTYFFKKYSLFIIFSLLIYVFLVNSSIIVSSVNSSLELFINRVFPSLFSFFLLVDFLSYFSYFKELNNIIRFKYSSLFIVSLISGLPSNAKYISLLSNISKKDKSILLSVSFFYNPMFVVSYLGCFLLNSSYIGFKLLIIMYLSNFIVYFINYRYLKEYSIDSKCDSKFFVYIKESIINNIKSLCIIYSFILIFTLINSIMKYYIGDSFILCLVNIILELTSGVYNLSIYSIPISVKAFIISMGLSISGISVIFQGLSIIDIKSIDFKLFIKNKMLVIGINLLLAYIVFIF